MVELPENVLNTGLSCSMEFGPNWLTAIQPRLAILFPELGPKDLDRCEVVCRSVNQLAHAYIRENPSSHNGQKSFPIKAEFKEKVLQHFPWVNEKNLSQLYSQSCYYARK